MRQLVLRSLFATWFGLIAFPVQADWTLLDDFNAYPVGESIDGMTNAGGGEWVSIADFEYFEISEDPKDATNRVLTLREIESGTHGALLDDPRLSVPDGSTATLYARFYRTSQDSHVNFGLSDVEEPTNWPDFETQFRDQISVPFARDGGAFTPFDNIDELPQDEWIQLWMVSNNAADTNEYFIQSETSIPVQTKLSSGGRDVFDYRNGTTDPLETFWIRMNNEGANFLHLADWYLDDLNIDLTGRNLTVPGGAGGILGDYNGNGMLDAPDIDELATAVRTMSTEKKYDLNNDGSIDQEDHTFWVKDKSVAYTFIGDANLDGEFSSQDFIEVFLQGKYETQQSAGWAEGDWNADGTFGSADFIAAFLDGGYELGANPAVASVPEPSTWVLALIALLGLVRRRF